MDKKIIKYLKKNNVLTIATSVNNQPYCANCYYVFDELNFQFVFLSDESTRHISEAIENSKTAGTITTDNKSIAKIQGVQFVGEFIIPDEVEQAVFYELYYAKYPFAKAKPSKIWAIKLSFIKMTDNTLGFGKKLLWEGG